MAGPGRAGGGGGRKGDIPTWDQLKYPLPSALAEVVENCRRGNDPQRNVGLWLDKFLPRHPVTWELTAGVRTLALGSVCRTYKNAVAGAAAARLTEGPYPGEVAWRPFEAKTTGRLLVDYGKQTATEAALGLHPILGVPKIPGSAIKGMTRAYLTALDHDPKTIEALFGSEPEKTPLRLGHVIFFDALPKDGKFTLEQDVLTPHYGDYYQGNSPPADYLSPIPHTFLTVTHTTFVFRIGLAPPKGVSYTEDEATDKLNQLVGHIHEALDFFGLGAKKAAGYGRLSGDTDKQG